MVPEATEASSRSRSSKANCYTASRKKPILACVCVAQGTFLGASSASPGGRRPPRNRMRLRLRLSIVQRACLSPFIHNSAGSFNYVAPKARRAPVTVRSYLPPRGHRAALSVPVVYASASWTALEWKTMGSYVKVTVFLTALFSQCEYFQFFIGLWVIV